MSKGTYLCIQFTVYAELSLWWKAFLKNTPPNQQFWANGIQKTPRNPLFVIGQRLLNRCLGINILQLWGNYCETGRCSNRFPCLHCCGGPVYWVIPLSHAHRTAPEQTPEPCKWFVNIYAVHCGNEEENSPTPLAPEETAVWMLLSTRCPCIPSRIRC